MKSAFNVLYSCRITPDIKGIIRLNINTDRLRWLGVEFVVIALGVLSALAVDTWIDDRQEARQRAEYRASLIADLGTDIDNLRERMEYYMFIQDAGLAVIEVLEGRAEMDDAGLLFSAFNAAEEWDFVEQSSTFLDMQSTGHLSLLDDLDLRLSLARYYREMIPRQRLWNLPAEYRRIVRGIIPNDFQRAVHELCTSIIDPQAAEMADMWAIDWVASQADTSCLGDLSRFDLAAPAARLRQRTDAVEQLRYRVSQARIAVRLFEGQRAVASRLRERLLGQG
jgi:hypothetical protein